MNEFWDYFKGMFKKAEESSPSNPLIHEMIKRSEEEQEDFAFWKSTLVCQRLKNWLQEQYVIFTLDPDKLDGAIGFLDTPSSKGFVVHFYQTQYSRRDTVHFFDLLKELVLPLNYRTQISDLRSYERPNWVETVQRHYLKPRSKPNAQGRFNQGFGNVMIELTLRDDAIYNLKFRATTYKDHQFLEPKAFSSLMKEIFK